MKIKKFLWSLYPLQPNQSTSATKSTVTWRVSLPCCMRSAWVRQLPSLS